MMLRAFIDAGAFLFSVTVTGLFVWRGLDDLLAEVHPMKAFSLADGAPCPRCRKQLGTEDAQCTRCRLTLIRRMVRVTSTRQSYAIAERLNFGHYIETSFQTTQRQGVVIMAPLGPVVRVDDDIRLVFDGEDRLRELDNLTVGAGWRLPTRVIGQRSPLAVIGLLILVPVVTMLILAAPIYFLFQSLLHAYHGVSGVLAAGVRQAPDPTLGVGEIAALLLYLLGLALFSGLLLLGRTRPHVNRDIFR